MPIAGNSVLQADGKGCHRTLQVCPRLSVPVDQQSAPFPNSVGDLRQIFACSAMSLPPHWANFTVLRQSLEP